MAKTARAQKAKKPPRKSTFQNGGKRAGAGRPKGSTNKTTDLMKLAVVAAADSKDGLQPLDFLLAIMRAPEPVQVADEEPILFLARYKSWNDYRFEAAKAAAPYCHPRLNAIEHKGSKDEPIRLRVEFV